MILIRFILYGVVIYLIVRMLVGYVDVKDTSSGKPDLDKESKKNNKKISKEIGEYVDYEDVKK
jgi:hypothetical protein